MAEDRLEVTHLLGKKLDEPIVITWGSKKNELKRCPFCGSDDIDFGIDEGTLKGFDYVQCLNCGAEIHAIHRKGKCIAAIDAWNRRADDGNA